MYRIIYALYRDVSYCFASLFSHCIALLLYSRGFTVNSRCMPVLIQYNLYIASFMHCLALFRSVLLCFTLFHVDCNLLYYCNYYNYCNYYCKYYTTIVIDRFTNVRRDLYSDRQGLWGNAMFNTPGASINRGVGTYSNLHGSWSRIGPSTYDATHANGEWVNRWGCRTYLPSTARSLYDHRNVDPRDNLMPFETNPQNMPYTMPYY